MKRRRSRPRRWASGRGRSTSSRNGWRAAPRSSTRCGCTADTPPTRWRRRARCRCTCSRRPSSCPTPLGRIDRAAVGITDDFTFLFCFDFASIFERKNPLAVIDAFRRAFAPGAGPRLVIKSVNGGTSPLAWARLEAAIAGRPDIEVRDGYETAQRQRDLMAACDCYVSLHRAEGYGLTLAEAMAVARPVIGTAYSGNLEFMTPETSVLIPYEMVRVPFGCGPYPPTALWAEPDVDAAAEAMRTMASDPTAAAILGARARAHIERRHTAESRVDFVRTRLHDLRSSR